MVVTGLVDYRDLNVDAPVALALERTAALTWLAPRLTWGAIAGMTAVLLVILSALPRIFHAVASDGLLPAPVARQQARERVVQGKGAAVRVGSGGCRNRE